MNLFPTILVSCSRLCSLSLLFASSLLSDSFFFFFLLFSCSLSLSSFTTAAQDKKSTCSAEASCFLPHFLSTSTSSSYSPLSSLQSRPTHPFCSDFQPPPPLVLSALSIEAERAEGRGGGQTSWELPLWRKRLRQKGTRFTSADTHSDTKTPGSALFASSLFLSLSLSPRLAARLENKHTHARKAAESCFECWFFSFFFLLMPHPGLFSGYRDVFVSSCHR